MFKSKLLAAFAACLPVALAGCGGGGGGASSGAPSSGSPASGALAPATTGGVYSASELPSPVPSGGKNETVATSAVAHNAALEAATKAVNSALGTADLPEIQAAREAVDRLVAAAESLVEKAGESGTAADRTEAQVALTEARQWGTAARGRLFFAVAVNAYNAAFIGSTASERFTLASLSLDQLQKLDEDLDTLLVPAAESLVEQAEEYGHESDLKVARATLADLERWKTEVQKRLTDLMSSGTRAPDDSGTRPPGGYTPAVSIVGLDATHLEMTDILIHHDSPGVADTIEIVCPGTATTGNKCYSTDEQENHIFQNVDNQLTSDNYNLIYHSKILEDETSVDRKKSIRSLEMRNSELEPLDRFLDTLRSIPEFSESDFGPLEDRYEKRWPRSQWSTITPFGGFYSYDLSGSPDANFAYFGWAAEYSGYYTAYLFDGAQTIERLYAAAFGELHNGRPPANATWRGGMRGYDNFRMFDGEIALTYHFESSTVDVEISNIDSIDYDGGNISWQGLNVNSDASFYMENHGNHESGMELHPTLGYIDGDFYGPNAEESAGVFQRQIGTHYNGLPKMLVGGWLAVKEGSGGTAAPVPGVPSTGHR